MKNILAPYKLLLLILCILAVAAIFDDGNCAVAKTTKKITTLDQALRARVPVILKLGSDQCYPCRLMNPIIKELAVEQNGKAVFLDYDIYQNRELADKYNVRVIPTIVFFDKQGKFKAKTEGFMNKEQLLKMVVELGSNK